MAIKEHLETMFKMLWELIKSVMIN